MRDAGRHLSRSFVPPLWWLVVAGAWPIVMRERRVRRTGEPGHAEDERAAHDRRQDRDDELGGIARLERERDQRDREDREPDPEAASKESGVDQAPSRPRVRSRTATWQATWRATGMGRSSGMRTSQSPASQSGPRGWNEQPGRP